MACDDMPEAGTIVDTDEMVSAAEELELESIGLTVYPNPTSDLLNLHIQSEASEQARLSLLHVNGQLVRDMPLQLNNGTQHVSLSVRDLAGGFYVLRLSTEKGMAIKKVIIE